MKRKLFYLMLGWMVLMLAACGKQSGDAVSDSKEYVYRAQEVELKDTEKEDTVNLLSIKDDRMYLQYYRWTDQGSVMTLVSQGLDGSDVRRIELQVGNSCGYSWVSPAQDGGYYAVCEEYFEDDSDPENYIWRNDVYLIKLDAQGKEIFKHQMNEKEDGDYWLQFMKVLTDGQLIICDTYWISLYDADGNKVKTVTELSQLECNSALILWDGTLLLNAYNPADGRTVVVRLDVQTGELSDEYTLSGGWNSYMMYAGIGYDLLLAGNNGVLACNLGDTEPVKLMDYVDSDLISSNVYNLAAVSETEFYGMMDDGEGNTRLWKFTKVAPEDVADKEILTLGCYGLSWEIRKWVVEYNKTNEKYRVRVEDYSDYNTDEDYLAGISKMNTDIASGRVPDILLLDSQIPVESYISKGLFEDLYPYLEEDSQIVKEDLFPNVLAAYESNGKLYRIAPKFAVQTVVGKTSKVGSTSGWTLDELNQVLEASAEGTESFTEMSRDEMLRYSISMTGEQFINWETGECRFNSEEFVQLLEFVNTFPQELDDDYLSESYWMSYDSMWREDKVLLRQLYLDGFENYNYMKKVVFGEDITFIGFPAQEGNGSVIVGQLEMAMSSKSKHKDGAWEFIRYFLLDEYQSQISYYWPLSMKQAEILKAEAQKKPSYEDENGNRIEYEPTYTVGDVEIAVGPLTAGEAEEVFAFVKSIDQIYAYNENLVNIVMEEAASYFSGQKSVKEAADVIQSRVQIYVNENR